MNEDKGNVSPPCGDIGALCQQGVEEHSQYFACPKNQRSPQQDEALSLLHQLWKDGHISLHGYWCLAALLGL